VDPVPGVASSYPKPVSEGGKTGMSDNLLKMKLPLPSLNDREDLQVPVHFPPVIDAHVHIFPQGIFQALWEWFDHNAWPIRYRFKSPDVLEYLLSRGVRHVVAFQYAHRAGMARELNRYMVLQCRKFPNRVTGMATVFPGEEGSVGILREAFDSGLKGAKFHVHVQCFDMNSEEMDRIYNLCASEGKPVVIHAGREPKSPAYKCDPYELCKAEKIEAVLSNFPNLKLCVPHLGLDEIQPYGTLIEKYDNLWLDTAMALTDYLVPGIRVPIHEMRPDRIMYGSDFPNIPYAWDRELKWLERAGLSQEVLELVLHGNAMVFFDIDLC
jgi:uncharacterized protein